MSAIPGHGRVARDEAREDARATERSTDPFDGAGTTGRADDVMADLLASVRREP